MHTHYDNLQVSRRASDEVIKGAYRFLSQKWHPDKQPPEEKERAERRMTLINTAYAVLSDPVQRREHDEWIAEEEAREAAASAGPAAGARTEGPTPAPPQPASGGLSETARASYARSIASGHWPLALLLSVLAVSFVAGLLLHYIDALRQWTDAHPGVTFFALTAWVGAGASSIVGDRRKAILASSDDDTLRHLYDRSARRRSLAVISSVILVAGGAIAFAVMRAGRPDLPAASPLQAASAPPAAAPVPVGDATHKPVHVDNACDRTVLVTLAFKEPEDDATTWTIRSFRVAGQTVATLHEPPSDAFLVESGAAYWRAASEDEALTWHANDDEPGRRFVVKGEASERYKLIGETSLPRNEIRLTCPGAAAPA